MRPYQGKPGIESITQPIGENPDFFRLHQQMTGWYYIRIEFAILLNGQYMFEKICHEGKTLLIMEGTILVEFPITAALQTLLIFPVPNCSAYTKL